MSIAAGNNFNMKFKVLLIGAGKMAGIADIATSQVPRSHAQGIKLQSSLSLAAVVDPVGSAREEFSKRHGCSAFESLGEALRKENPDVVCICSPNETHANYLLELAKLSRPPKLIIVEKPLCTDLKQLRQIQQTKFPCPVVVNQTRRFRKDMTRLRDFLLSEPFGKIVGARFVYYGGWVVNAVHAIDQFRFLTGCELSKPQIFSAIPSRAHDFLLEGRATIIQNGTDLGVVKFDTVDESHFQLFELELRYQNGRIFCRNFASEIHVETVTTNEIGERELTPQNQSFSDSAEMPIMALYAQAARFLAGEVTERELTSSLDENLPTMITLLSTLEEVARC